MTGSERSGSLLARLRRRPTGGVVTHQQRALVLAMRGKYHEAAQLLLAQLPMPLRDSGALHREHRRQATIAATYLTKAGRTATAGRLTALLERSRSHATAPGCRPDPVRLEKLPEQDALGPAGATRPADNRGRTLPPKQSPGNLDIGPTLLVKVPEEVGASKGQGAVVAPTPAPARPSGAAEAILAKTSDPGHVTPQLMRQLRQLRTARNLRSSRPSDVFAPGPATYPYELGERIADRFVLEARIGHGGMASVYRARDLELEEEVALKVFTQPLGGSEADLEGLRRFRQELKLSRSLVHPHVIRVYDIGVHEARRYITMELLRGASLDQLIGAPVEPGLALCLLVQACRGVQAAHQQGVVHRDLKPDNLFVTDEGLVKVMDFGIAKSAHIRGPTLVGTTAGTPEYMSPEQISDFSAVGPAADQYSLGIVAYELLTGSLPFEHNELVKLFYMHLERPPAPIRQHQPDLPAELEVLVARMLSKDPTQRYPDLASLLTELSMLRNGFRRAL